MTTYRLAAIRCLLYAAECRLMGHYNTARDWIAHARNFNRLT